MNIIIKENFVKSNLLIHSEDFLSVLLAFMKHSLKTKTLNGFKEMNEALKKEVERLRGRN